MPWQGQSAQPHAVQTVFDCGTGQILDSRFGSATREFPDEIDRDLTLIVDEFYFYALSAADGGDLAPLIGCLTR